MIGSYNTLKVVKLVDFGIYLDAGAYGEVLMPTRYVPEGTKVDDMIEVFLYTDSEDRPIATTATPYAAVGDFAAMKVKAISSVGAFLDWGIMKDLLVPFSEQRRDLSEGETCVVYVYLDSKTSRVVASAKYEKFLEKEDFSELEPDMQVDIMIASKTDLGYKAIIDNKYIGLIYKNEVFKPLKLGDKLKAYIRQIREDGKIDLRLQRSGYDAIKGEAELILNKLNACGGFIATTDKSPAELIYDTYNISKKTYKKAVGDLYKHGLIKIQPDGIKLV